MILCGGLAGSRYIHARLTEFCKRVLPFAEVIVPPNPWAAICLGAALSNRGSSFVTSRKARRSYGTVVLETFIENEHDEHSSIVHPEFGKMVQRMFWHIKKVQSLSKALDELVIDT